jgi:hypothetical protein
MILALVGLDDDLPFASLNSDHNWSGEQLLKARRSKRHHDKVGTIAQAAAFIRERDARKHRADAAADLVCGGQR